MLSLALMIPGGAVNFLSPDYGIPKVKKFSSILFGTVGA
jgi:hypothetical protein